MHNESSLKMEILSRGVKFNKSAIELGILNNAKMQNLCYNAPQNVDFSFPSELEIIGQDDYATVVSCVAPTGNGAPVVITAENGQLITVIDGEHIEYVHVHFVPQPSYYSKRTKLGWPVQNLISACGADELNIIPWRGCSLPKSCKFCGINKVVSMSSSILPASSMIRSREKWNEIRKDYLEELEYALELAISDSCYENHFHPILISGNLEDLDLQAEIYCEISAVINKLLPTHKFDHLVAVMTPPKDLKLIKELANSGIDVLVFNQEIANEYLFSNICPGKAELGANYFFERLIAAIETFGTGRVWSNFVFGLEPQESLLAYCEWLASFGIVPGANVYHRDLGSNLNHKVPTAFEIASFYISLCKIYVKYNIKPFYCSRALRTSLANEAYEGRLSSLYDSL